MVRQMMQNGFSNIQNLVIPTRMNLFMRSMFSRQANLLLNLQLLFLLTVLVGGYVGWERTAFGEEWQPVTRSSEKIVHGVTEEWHCYSPANPHYYADSGGTLKAIDYTRNDVVEEIGGKQYSKKIGTPISAGLLKNATYEKFVSVHSDLDWQYPDRRMEWTLVDAEFNKTKKMPKLDSPAKVNNLVRKASDDYAVYNDRTTVRLAQRIPIKSSTDFVVTYRLRLVDLTIANLSAEPTSEEFTVTTLGGEFRFRIRLPKLLDADFMVVSQNTLHSIEMISEGLYEYKKYPSPKLTIEEIQSSTWIDADTYYGSISDGYVYNYNAVWSTCRNASTGLGSSTNGDELRIETATNFLVTRAYPYYDTSSVPKTAESVLHYFYATYSTGNFGFHIFQGTQADTLTVDDFDSFTGSTIGYKLWYEITTSQYNSITLTASGVSYVNSTNLVKLCIRDREDVLNYEPSTTQRLQWYATDKLGTNYDPYLSIVVAATTSTAAQARYYYQMMNSEEK